MRKSFYIISLMLFVSFRCFSQDREQLLNNYIENIVEQIVSSNENEGDVEAIISDLEYLYRYPLNLNSASFDEFEKLWILNDFQIGTLLAYRKKMRQIASVHELRYIDGFNDRLVDLVSPFVFCGKNEKYAKQSAKQIIKRSSHELLLRTTYRSTTANNHLGSPLQQYTRYTGNFGNKINVGLLGEKDAGEEFGKGTNPLGYDFYSGHIQFTSRGIIKNVTLGDFRVRLGQGLLVWNGYSSGKSGEITTLMRRGQGVTGNTSSDEYNFMRGASATLYKKGFSAIVWGSSRKLDGAIDSVDNEPFYRDISIGGYHRTKTETERKHNLEELTYGASVGYKSLHYSFGVNWLHTSYSAPLDPTSNLTKSKGAWGADYNGLSADFKMLFQKVQLYGEIAHSNKGIASITGINMMPSSRFSALLFYRHYQPEYFSPYSNGIVESGDVNNEKGFFSGISWYTDWDIILTAYSDVFSFPWLQTYSQNLSNGADYHLEMNYNPRNNFQLTLRYKYKEKGRNYTADNAITKDIIPFGRQSYRIHSSYNITEKLNMASRFEYALSGFENKEILPGYLIYQDINYRFSKSFRLSFRYARFHVEDYDSRIYAYEKDALFAYSIPAYYSMGQKSYLMLRQKLGKSFTLWLRYAYTDYFSEETRDKHEFRGQLIVTF